MTATQEATSEFPIFDAPMSARDEMRKIGCVDPTARIAIKALQPHNGGNPHSHPLWHLHELNRIDKHRMLTACAVTPERPYHVSFIKTDDWNIASIIYADIRNPQLVPDAIFMRYVALPLNPEADVRMQPSFPTEVTFGPTTITPLKPIVPTTQAILDFVRNSVVSPLSQFL
jgi:hypothetical protein